MKALLSLFFGKNKIAHPHFFQVFRCFTNLEKNTVSVKLWKFQSSFWQYQMTQNPLYVLSWIFIVLSWKDLTGWCTNEMFSTIGEGKKKKWVKKKNKKNKGQHMSFDSCPSESTSYPGKCMNDDPKLEVCCCSNEKQEHLNEINSNTAKRPFYSSQSWCEQYNGHICNISELNTGICCNRRNTRVWVQDKCKMQDMYCSQETSGLGQVMEEIVVEQYTNDKRIMSLMVYVYLKNSGNGVKTISLEKGSKTVVLAQQYSDKWDKDYGLAFEENAKTRIYLQNVSESKQLTYTSLEPLSLLVNAPVSGRYRLSISSTQALEELHLYQWCIQIQYQQLLTMITTFFIDMSFPSPSPSSSFPLIPPQTVNDVDRKNNCRPFSSIVYDNNETILNISITSVEALDKIMCGQWFSNGALEACINHIQSMEPATTYYHICQFVIVTMSTKNNSNDQTCGQWNPNDTYTNISAMANGPQSRLPGQVIYTAPSYMQMAQFCPPSICRPDALRVCIDYHIDTFIQTHLQHVSFSMLGIDWHIQTRHLFWTLWSAGDGLVQITMSECSFSITGKGQSLFRFLNDGSTFSPSSSSAVSPVVNITLTQMIVTAPEDGQANPRNHTLFYVSQACQVWLQNWSVHKHVGHVMYGANVRVFILRNALIEFVANYDLHEEGDLSAFDATFELFHVALFVVDNSTFIDITSPPSSTLPHSTLFAIAMAHAPPLNFYVSHSIFQSLFKHVLDISLIQGSSFQYVILQDILFDRIHGLTTKYTCTCIYLYMIMEKSNSNENAMEMQTGFDVTIENCTFRSVYDSTVYVASTQARLWVVDSLFEQSTNCSVICHGCRQLNIYSVAFIQIWQYQQPLVAFDAIRNSTGDERDNLATFAAMPVMGSVEVVDVTFEKIECVNSNLIACANTSMFTFSNVELIESSNPLVRIETGSFFIHSISLVNNSFDKTLEGESLFEMTLFANVFENTPDIGVDIRDVIVNNHNVGNVSMDLFHFDFHSNSPVIVSDVIVNGWNGELFHVNALYNAPVQILINNISVRHYHNSDRNHSCALCVTGDNTKQQQQRLFHNWPINVSLVNCYFTN
ncbi:hypothetical protein RFI_11697, partial [Reticulomyxa filosa]